ncbi:hypothetical protein F5883DRAFT_663061 [Diaporthe sp. PMI_573]|nr:hypothetical protein F5883DRAFT_663061 [Diaporthaceae sp. PMI_573]
MGNGTLVYAWLTTGSRVGGGSQDHVISTPSVTGDPGFYNVFDPVPVAPQDTKSLFPQAYFTGAGFNYWLSACNLPKGTKYTWGINFQSRNVSEGVAQVQQLERAFAHRYCRDVSLLAIELGNEADLWADGRRRPEDWTIWDYTAEQLDYFDAITKAIGHDGRKYRIADWAGELTSSDLLGTGIMELPMGRFIAVISEHRYQGTASMSPRSEWPKIASGLIKKENIRGRLEKFGLSALKAREAGIDFVLGETGSFAGHGQAGVSNAAAAALWMVDYSLQAASNGIPALQFHHGVGYYYNAFQPIDNIGVNITDFDPEAKRHVLPLYYGYLVMADIIGDSGKTFVNEIKTDSESLAAYQIWVGRELKRLVLINSTPWTELSEGTRPVLTVGLPKVPHPERVKIKHLDLPSISAMNGLKWGGQSWETDDGKPEGTETFGKLDSGQMILMNASSVAVVYL